MSIHINRRDFLRASALSAAGLTLTPEHAIAKTSRRKACQKPFFFIQYADPQFGFIDDQHENTEPEEKLFGQVVDIINRLRPAFVIGTGDYHHHHRNEREISTYLKFVKQIDPSIPVLMVPGNHDIPSLEAEDLAFYNSHIGKSYFYYTYENCAFIGLNSTWMTNYPCEEEARQRQWLEEKLKEAQRCRFIFVIFHISLFLNDADEEEHYSNFPKAVRQSYIDLFQQNGVSAVLSGHRHKPYTGKVGQMDMITCGSCGRQLGGFEGMNLWTVYPDRYTFCYKALDNFPHAYEP